MQFKRYWKYQVRHVLVVTQASRVPGLPEQSPSAAVYSGSPCGLLLKDSFVLTQANACRDVILTDLATELSTNASVDNKDELSVCK
jgi:hypothetical protein